MSFRFTVRLAIAAAALIPLSCSSEGHSDPPEEGQSATEGSAAEGGASTLGSGAIDGWTLAQRSDDRHLTVSINTFEVCLEAGQDEIELTGIDAKDIDSDVKITNFGVIDFSADEVDDGVEGVDLAPLDDSSLFPSTGRTVNIPCPWSDEGPSRSDSSRQDLIVEFTRSGPGRGGMATNLAIHYQSGGRQHTLETKASFGLCPSDTEEPPPECDFS